MNPRSVLHALVLVVALFSSRFPSGAAITLTGGYVFGTDSSGAQIGSIVWDTDPNAPYWNMWLNVGTPGGSPDGLTASFLNGPSNNQAAISLELTPGIYHFTVFGDLDIASTAFYGMNLFFNGNLAPGISAKTAVRNGPNIPPFSANASPYTFAANGGFPTPGSGKLTFITNNMAVTLIDFYWAQPSVFTRDRTSRWTVQPDGLLDCVGTFTLTVSETSVGTNVPAYTLTDLGTLGGNSSYAFGINDSGKIVGFSTTSNGGEHAFLYSDGQMQDLGTLGGNFSIAYGINNSGRIVGNSAVNASNSIVHAFLFADSSMQDLGTLGGDYSSANGINDNGQVIGESHVNGNQGKHAFLYANASMQDLGTLGGNTFSAAFGVNASGQIVGVSLTNDAVQVYHSFLYSGGFMQDLGTLGGGYSEAREINDSGQITGWSITNGQARPFLYANGSMRDLGTLGGTDGGAYGINDGGQIVGWSYISGSSAQHAFLYSGGKMHDLNDLLANPTGSILYEARSINEAGQIVGNGWNPSGLNRAFLLTPTPWSWREAINTHPVQPIYGDCPQKLPGKDNLVLVTHGWIPREAGQMQPPDPAWVHETTNAIGQYLTASGSNNWQVSAYFWKEKAWATKWGILLGTVINNAASEGANLGKGLASQGWSHIHLIAHSAGSALIQEATETIKSAPANATIVHETFLDAYVGLGYGGKSKYGNNADWADSYFSHDLDTLGQYAYHTEGPLEHAYNVDVTLLDPLVVPCNPTQTSSGSTIPYFCNTSTHAWPYLFYRQTIPPDTIPGATTYGFFLSKEAGHWGTAMSLKPQSGEEPVRLGCANPACTVGLHVTPPLHVGPNLNFAQLPTAQSPEGVIQMTGPGFRMTTHSPVWLATSLTVTDAVNFLTFESQFLGTTNGSAGLLSVFWDTNVVWTVDEGAARSGLKAYNLTVPRGAPNTSHILGFRLDSFTNIQSSVVITNVTCGFVGANAPFSLAALGRNTNGFISLRLTGPTSWNYAVYASTNLIDWKTIALIASTNGSVTFDDPDSTNLSARFYRAVAP